MRAEHPSFKEVLAVLRARRHGEFKSEPPRGPQDHGPYFPVIVRQATELAKKNFDFCWTENGHYSSGGYYGHMDFVRFQLSDRVVMIAAMEGQVALVTLQTYDFPKPVPVPLFEESILALFEF
jgi:hypothetical protein